MEYRIIKTKKQYKQYLERMKTIFDAKKGSKEEGELELLSLLIEKYENEHFPIPSPDPVEAIKFIMEQNNMDNTDLAKILNSASRASEILSRKRKLSISHIRKIHSEMKIPVDVLIKEYELV